MSYETRLSLSLVTTRHLCRVTRAVHRPAARAAALTAIVLCAAAPGFAQPPSSERPTPPRPTVGAIRWDAWTEWGYFQRFLQPKEWHDRLPFFAKTLPDGTVEVRCDNQEVMDKEIGYAKRAGLDYWAFDWYHPSSKPAKNFMTRCLDLYLGSAHRADINYCLVLLAGGDGANGDFHLGSKEEWPATTDYLVQRFSDANYQKVLGNRPLAYFFETENWLPLWGSREAVQGAWKILADK